MLSEKQFHNILKAQARFVRAPASFFKPYFEGKKMPKEWYLKHSWTEKQEEKFREWLVKYLIKIDRQPRKMADRKARWYCFTYGWKYRKAKSNI